MTGDLVLQRGFRITRTIDSPAAITVLFSRKAVPAPRGKRGSPTPVVRVAPNPKVKVLREKGKPRFYWYILPWIDDPSRRQFEAEALRRLDDSSVERESAAAVRPPWSPK